MVLLQKEAVAPITIDTCNDTGVKSTKLECDYDINPTELYQAIEAQQWEYIMNMYNNKVPLKAASPESEKASISEQANTWVVRKENDGRLRWRMLPIHALMIFKAPFKVFDAILSAAPRSVNSKDDRGMVPLHLGFRHEADDASLSKIISMCSGALEMKDRKGRTPLQCCNAATSKKGKLMQEYNHIALAAERRRVSKELNIEHERKMNVLKNAYEQEIAASKKKMLHTEAEVKSARTACNAMMRRVANMSNTEKQLREDSDKVRGENTDCKNDIAALASKITHINTVHCAKSNPHSEALNQSEEEQCAIITPVEKLDNILKSIVAKDEQYNQAVELIAEKDDLLSILYEKIDKLDTLNRTKEEVAVVAQVKFQMVENEVEINRKEKTVFKELVEDAKIKTCNLSSTIENLTCRNAYLEKELESREKKVEQQRDWLDNAHQVFGKILTNSSANWNNAREKIVLSTSKEELELHLVADNRERAVIAKEVAILKTSLDLLIAKELKDI